MTTNSSMAEETLFLAGDTEDWVHVVELHVFLVSSLPFSVNGWGFSRYRNQGEVKNEEAARN